MNKYVEPKISVVMSIYNEPEDWLRESIKSILNQTFTDFEFIIINDNPERLLNNILLNEYQRKDSRILIIKNEENIGLTKSLNKGLKRAKGKYIARMDGDDISYSERLKVQYLFMEENQTIGVCGTYIEVFGNQNRYDKSLFIESDIIKSSLIYKSPFAHPSVLIRREILVQNNIEYNEEFEITQDYKLWSDLSKVTNFANIPYVLLKYRSQKLQISQYKKKRQAELAKRIRLQEIKKYLQTDFENFKKIKKKKDQFTYIAVNFKQSPSKSFLLLTIYFSFKTYNLFDLFRLIKYLDLYILRNQAKMIIKKSVFPDRYSNLI